MIDRDTQLSEIGGYYRSTLLACLDAGKRAIKKVIKGEDEIFGETAHLNDKLEIIDEFKAALGAAADSSIKSTPMGDALKQAEAEGGRKHSSTRANPDQIDMELDGVDLADDKVITMMLALINFNDDEKAIEAEVATWAIETRRDVYRWSRAMQLVGTEAGVNIKVPPRPLVVKQEWLAKSLRDLITSGEVEPETQHPVDAMSDVEIGDWIGRGPWFPRPKSDAAGSPWHLVWKGEQEDGLDHSYAFEHPDEASARKVAAAVNKMIFENAQKPDTSSIVEAPAMNEDDIAAFLARGPWGVTGVEPEDGDAVQDARFTLEWIDTVEENAQAPTHTFVYDTEAEARRVAAEKNRELAEPFPGAEDDEPAQSSEAPSTDDKPKARKKSAAKKRPGQKKRR